MDWDRVPAPVRRLCRRLWAAGKEALPVGGCVRDLLLGRAPGDWDVTTSALPEEVMALFRRAIPTGLKHGTVTVLSGPMAVEVTTFRREEGYADGRHPDAVAFDATLEQDLGRRDFTINAMALGRDGGVEDLFGGREDLAAGVVRCVGEPERRFAEDALRMLRAVRFAAQLGFSIEPGTARAMEACAGRVAAVSRERIRAEMEKTLLSPRPEAIGLMVRAGLLDHLYDWDKGLDFSPLAASPGTKEGRWQAFCALTGFPISALPVERKLRRAVEHPEAAALERLALTGRELKGLGLRGEAIGQVRRRLAEHILAHPEDNDRRTLLRLWRSWQREQVKEEETDQARGG